MAKLLTLLLFAAFAAPALAASDLDKAFGKDRFEADGARFQAYVADDDEKRQRGLMFVEKLDADTGMIFVFEEERTLNFWMKNTLIPLSIGFFDADGRLVDTQEMKPAASLLATDVPTYASAKAATFAIEMPANWFPKHGLKSGARLKLLSPTKSALLKRKLARQ